MRGKIIFTVVYILIVLTEILADFNGHFNWVYITKPLIIISLICYIHFTSDKRFVQKRNVFITGLFFALLGDVLLMIRERDLFIPGLGSFLAMQILYSYAFYADNKSSVFTVKTFTSKIPFLLLALFLYLILYPNLPDSALKFAVGVYAYSIASMTWLAFLRKSSTSHSSYLMVFSGALLFMISDSFIAIDRFLMVIPFNTFWVMGSYAAAQYLISFGFLKTK